MKLWVLGIAAAVVLLVGLPAVTLALADDPTPAVTSDGPGRGPAHENPGHHFGWTKDHGRSEDRADHDEQGHGQQGPPPWAHGNKSKHDHPGPPPWSHGDDDTD